MNKKIKALIAVTLWIALLFITIPVIASSVNNVTSEGVDGNLVFYDSSKNEIFTIDATNRRLSIPSGSSLYSTSTTVTLGGVTYTWPGADGSASQFIQTDGSGTLSWATGGATAYDDIADPDADSSITFQNNEILAMDFSDTDEDMFTIQGLGAFGDVSVVKIEQKTGNATNGTVLEVVSADTDVDALVVNANSTEILNIGGSGTFAVNGAEFDVSGTTGAITINDGGDAGQISIEGSVLDINSLTFVGAGEIATAASSALTLNVDSGSVAGEDLIITAHNIQLTATGAMTMSPDAAVTTAIDITDTDFTNAISVGDNAILGTTGIINYTNFDVDASGNVTAVDGTFSGNLSVTGTFQQDAISAATAATTLTVDGTGVGGVTIGGTSTGAITLGGGATQVTLPSTVDLVLSGGDITATDTANADMVTFTNNTMTTADLVTLSASGTRTSDNVIEIVDGATTASTIGITANAMTEGSAISVTANAQTSGYGFSYANSGAVLTGAAINLAVTDGVGFTGSYLRCYDGAAEDFTIKQYGATTIAGNASTNVLTVTTGDVQIDDGKLEIDTNEDDTTKVERAQATVTGPVLSVIEQTHTAASGYPALFVDQNTTTGTTGAIEIDTEGAVGIKFDALIAAGDAILIDVANSYTGQGIVADLGPWLGTAGEGFIALTSDAGAVAEVGSGIKLNFRGTTAPGSAVDGKGLWITEEADAKAGQSLVFLDSKNNDAIHISNEGAGANGIKFDVANSYTGQGIIADLGPWLGTAGEGFIDIDTDSGAVAEAGHAIKINFGGTTADAAAISGKGLYIKDAAAATAGSFLLHVESDVNGAAYLDGDIDVKFTNNDDNLDITSNATDYAAGDAILHVHDTSAGQTNTAYLLRLSTEADADANNAFILCEDNSSGAAANGDTMFEVSYDGSITTAGNIAGDGATIVSGVVKSTEIVDGANVLTAAETGKVIFLNAAGGVQHTLPAISTVTAGSHFKFIVKTAPSGGSYTIITGNSLENVIYGGVNELEVDTGDDGPWISQGDTITIVDSVATIGDYIEVISDGTNWYVSGQTKMDGGCTLTQAD